jgi:hypothetical protein
MSTIFGRATTINAGLAVIICGWAVMAFALGYSGIQLGMVQTGMLFAGFCVIIGGFCFMIWAER